MEIEGEDGSIFTVKGEGFQALFGRGSGFNTGDRTVSRRHVLFQLTNTENQTEPRVSFQVVGKNPLWLRSGDGERKIRFFRKLEKGEMEAGDCFCISSQSPVWFSLKKLEVKEEKDLDLDFRSERLGDNWESVDVSQIDPVKEFGFLVIGREFDCYPKQSIRNPKNWDWFLEETKQDDEKKRKRGGRRKRKKDEDEDDDEWTDESEYMESAAKIKKVDRPKYITRSKDQKKPFKAKGRKIDISRMKVAEDEDEDEDDDTLGGFIVNDEDDEEEGGNDEDEEEEEELMEDEEEEEVD